MSDKPKEPEAIKDLLEEAFMKDFQMLAYNKLYKVEFTLLELWVILANLQLALRHSLNIGSSSHIAFEVAKKIQEIVSITPALKNVAERGWNPEEDV